MNRGRRCDKIFLSKDLSEVSFQEIKDALPMKSVEESRDIFLDYLKIPKEKYKV
ncbi:MAG: hypothetical protein KAJ79_04995 [Candidatus Omnitrophica bacterium]|nr:hypothetical protein [Candidatus Omnitrophota bacterium]